MRWIVALDGLLLVLQMPGDRGGAGVQAPAQQVRPQLDDPGPNRVRGAARVGPRPARAGLDGIQAAVAVAGQEPVDPLPRHPELRCGLRRAQPLLDDGQHDHARLRHARDCQR